MNTFAQWRDSLSVEQTHVFDSEGRGYKKDCGDMMRAAFEAGAAAEREACARVCEEKAQATASMYAKSADAKNANAVAMSCADAIRNRAERG